MTLSDHDLRQLDESYMGLLAHDQLMALSLKLLADLKVARDRLNPPLPAIAAALRRMLPSVTDRFSGPKMGGGERIRWGLGGVYLIFFVLPRRK
ncbi:MAG: hypothetical protein HW380_1387 [Magnetococcales bacterium]|nr:hypothetical protein [Magnetococcales bacterium]